MPFAKKPDPTQQSTLLPILIAAGLVATVIVALQHFLLFGSRTAVFTAACLFAGGGAIACWRSVKSLEDTIRFHVANLALETSSLYREVH